MTGRLPSQPADRRDGGFVVVAALWLLAALAVLATIASIYVTQSAKALAALDATAQMDMLTSAGIELAAYQLSAPATTRRPRRGRFGFRLAKCDVTVEYLSEAARINLNMASKAMLAGLFAAVGAEADAAGQFADRVLGWRGGLKPNMQDAEDGIYRAAGLRYLPRRAPFNSADELWLLPGMPAAIVERAMPYVTVYSGIAEINVLDAAPEAIAALPDMTPARLDAFLSQRESLPPDPEIVLGALGGKQVGATTGASDAYRVRIRIKLPNGRQRTSEAVIAIPPAGEKEAFRVLAWREDIGAQGEP
jgi:general secretion pathway protein K